MKRQRPHDDRHDWIPSIQVTPEDRKAADNFARTTIADRIKATIRHPAYWDDVKEFRRGLSSAKHPNGKTIPLFWEKSSSIADRWNLPATIIDNVHAKRLIAYFARRPWRSSEAIRTISIQPRFVLLSIDLSETAIRLTDLFSFLVNSYQRELGWAKHHRNRSFQCNPFDAYDLIEEQGLNTLLATQKIFGRKFEVGQGPAYDKEAKRQYEQVNRAHKWAKALINQIGKEAGH